MRTELMQVSPSQAKAWLEKNIGNRPLRRMRVDALRQAWERGEWKVTHQGVAFSKDGTLKDGQHRLTFIAELPASARVPLHVTWGLDDDVFGVIDVGVHRNAADEMAIDQSLAAVASMLAALYNGNQRAGLTTPYLKPFVEFARPHYDSLVGFCSTNRVVWSSAPVRTAAVVQMARGHNADFVRAVYRSLVMRDPQAMTPTARALANQVQDGKAGGARSFDLFVRALRVFDSKAPNVKKVQVKSVTDVTSDVRQFLEAVISAPKLIQKKTVSPAA